VQPETDNLASDAEVVRRVLGGETEAFGLLVARYERSMGIIAHCVMRDRQLAEDAVQDGFLAAYRSLPSLKNVAAFGAWLAMIVRRRARELSRGRVVTVPLGEELPDRHIPGLDFDAERVLEVLLDLPEVERQVLLLRHFEGLEVAAIGRITGESGSTVSKRLFRAHARMREILTEYQP